MQCDMCGTEATVRANIEGALLNVCGNCAKFGEVVSKIETPVVKEVKEKSIIPQRQEIITLINSGYPQLIKNRRERLGLKQEELAKQIGERTSVIHSLETGHREPNLELARKLEKKLNISLVESYEETGRTKKTENKAMTIGDMLNVD